MEKILTITGSDRSGKHTQARLLAAALGPETTLMSFPEYDRPIGMLLKALYRDQFVRVQREIDHDQKDWIQENSVSAIQPRDPMYIQLLNTLARVEAQGRIGEALKHGHVVMDRYDADTFIYGAAQGVRLKHLTALHEMLAHQSDFVFYLYGAQFDRGGEKDCNEKDQRLQNAVAQNCIALANLYPERSCAVDMSLFQDPFPGSKIACIEDAHLELCSVLRERGIVKVRPLCQEKIEHLVELSDHEKQEVLA